jgi:hypothetical protein
VTLIVRSVPKTDKFVTNVQVIEDFGDGRAHRTGSSNYNRRLSFCSSTCRRNSCAGERFAGSPEIKVRHFIIPKKMA